MTVDQFSALDGTTLGRLSAAQFGALRPAELNTLSATALAALHAYPDRRPDSHADQRAHQHASGYSRAVSNKVHLDLSAFEPQFNLAQRPG